MEGATPGMTMGMRLDSWISQIDNLSSTQLYGLIVAATVGLCFVLLGSGNVHDVEFPEQPTSANFIVKKDKTRQGPQPRWHIFRWINYMFIAAFLWSVGAFALNASTYLNHDSQGVLMQFLFGWSVFLCYFFGFFGISLIHDFTEDEQEEDGSIMVNNSHVKKDSPPSAVPSMVSSVRYVFGHWLKNVTFMSQC
jgi:hypothetical protein